jgi:hypothetical protein
MRFNIFTGVLAAATLLAGAALAQGLTQGGANGTPGGMVAAVGNASGGEIVPYVFHWSQNPAPQSTFTSDPGFVEHSHGRP